MEERVQRRLAAILAADVVGYSRLMGEDEEGTLVTLKSYRSVIDELIRTHDGRVFGAAGDSVIAEFASPVEAVRCATEIQLELDKRSADVPDARRMRFRIGVNLGDVMVEGDNLMGDGVNVAARLEALAAPGGLCISDNVINHVRDRLGLEFEDLGPHQVKNISYPVHVYRVPLVSEFRDVSPFRGLSVFEYEDARFFHGRAKAIATATERLKQQAAAGTAFLLIYGMSGAGKSSLVRAGLLPALTKPGAIQGITPSRYCIFRPSEGPDPRTALSLALRRDHALPEIVGLPGIDRLFQQAPQAIVATIDAALSRVGGLAARLIIVVDQLEELFTAKGCDAVSREAFVGLLAALARSRSVWVIGTIRTDFLHHCASVPGLSELKDGLGSYELLPPAGPEIAQIIRNPARTVGLRFEERAEEGRLEDVLQQAAASDPSSLPLLEFVLDALYEAGKERRLLTFADYRALGGLEGAIAKRADDVTGTLPPDVQAALPAVVSALTTVRQQGEEATGRPAFRREIAATPAQTALVDALIDARLLVSDEGAGGAPMVRFVHEALLSQWPLAREIVAANREFLTTRARVQADARRWLAEDKNPDLLLPPGKRLAEAEDLLHVRGSDLDAELGRYIEMSATMARAHERRRLRRVQLFAAAMAALAIVAGIGGYVGFRGEQAATRQAELAEQNAAQARAAEQEAERQAQAALTAKDKAVASERDALLARNQALRNQSLFLAFQARQRAAAGDTATAVRLALDALPRDVENPYRPYVVEAETVLYETLLERREAALLRHDGGVTHVAFSPSGDRIVTASFDQTARVWDLQSGSQVAILRGHTNELEQANFSPNGKQIVTASNDGTARVWDAETGREIVALPVGGLVRHASFSPNGERIVTDAITGAATIWNASTGQKVDTLRARTGRYGGIGAANFSPDGLTIATPSSVGAVTIWNAADGRQIARLSDGRGGTVTSVAFSPDGGRILFARRNLTALLWDIAAGRKIALLAGHTSSIRGTVFSPDGRLAATISVEGSARLWDATTGDLITALGTETGVGPGDVRLSNSDADMNGAFSPDGRLLATAAADGLVRIWDIGREFELTVLRGHDGPVEHVAFSPDGERLATASHDGTARLWDVDGISITRLRGQQGRPSFVVFSPDGGRVATAASDKTARVWDAANGREIAVLGGHEGSVLHVAFDPDGRRVATASQDGTARLWDADSGEELAVLKGHDGGVKFVDFSNDGKLVVSASSDGTARLWDASTGAEQAVLRGHEKSVNLALFDPDDRLILTASDDGTARLWEIGGSKPLQVFAGHERRIRAAAFSPDGQLVVTASDDRTARIWKVDDGSVVTVMQGHNAPVFSAAFSPDGRKIATASSDHTARLWDTETGAQLAVLGHGGPVTQVAFSPNGETVITTSRDGTARLWRVETGAEYTKLPGHTETVRHAAFSPDGTLAATVSDDRVGRIFPVFPTTQALIDHARSVVPRELTPCERKRFFLSVEGEVGDCPN